MVIVQFIVLTAGEVVGLQCGGMGWKKGVMERNCNALGYHDDYVSP